MGAYDPSKDVQVYDNPKQRGTVCVRISKYKCVVVDKGVAAELSAALLAYLKEGKP